MTVKHRPQLRRRALRARLRRGPAWTLADLAVTVPVVIAGLIMLLSPALLADIGDSVIGPTTYIAELGTNPSTLLLAIMRLLLMLGVLYVLLAAREAPWVQRTAWAWLALGVMMNYSRAVYSTTYMTWSFFIIQVALLVLLYFLSMRPTVWERLTVEQGKTKAALEDSAALREELRESRDEATGWRRKYETAEKLLGRNP